MSVAVKEEEALEETDPGDTVSAAVTPPNGVVCGPIDLIDAICSRVKEEMHAEIQQLGGGGGGGGGEPPHPPSRTILGDTAKGWGTWLVRATVAFAVGAFAWYTTVNESLDDRPTRTEAAAIAESMVKVQEAKGSNPETRKILGAHSEQLRQLREIQIRQTTLMEGQSKTIDKIEKTLDRRRR